VPFRLASSSGKQPLKGLFSLAVSKLGDFQRVITLSFVATYLGAPETRLLVSQGDDWINLHRPPRWNVTGEK